MPLGQGCGPITNRDGPLDVETRIFLMRNFMRRAARHQKLLMYLHNIKMRSDNARAMKAFVRTDSIPMEAFRELSTSEGFTQRLDAAVANPESCKPNYSFDSCHHRFLFQEVEYHFHL